MKVTPFTEFVEIMRRADPRRKGVGGMMILFASAGGEFWRVVPVGDMYRVQGLSAVSDLMARGDVAAHLSSLGVEFTLIFKTPHEAVDYMFGPRDFARDPHPRS